MSPWHGNTSHLLIQDGKYLAFGDAIETTEETEVFDYNACYLTPSFIDLRCNSSEPGYEHRDTFNSLNNTALAGGFSHLAMIPNCFPARNTKTEIEYVIQQNQKYGVEFLPLGSITKDLKGEDLSEMFDMQSSGAVAFSNGNNAIENSGTLSKALLYSKNFNALIYSFCHLSEMSKGAYVSEGSVALSLGLKGIPQMAEYLQVQRDIELADYHQHRIHISKISTERSVEIIRQAKIQGIKVTCDVALMNLVLTDEAIMDFNSLVKVMPPLRQANDVKALWEGIIDGTIDAICTDHYPLEIEKKDVEFEYAAFGSLNLQIAFSMAVEGRNRFMPNCSDEILISKLNQGPANILSLQNHSIKEGQKAQFTVINPHKQTILNTKNNQSLSQNSYYFNKPLPYFIEGIMSKNQFYINKK